MSQRSNKILLIDGHSFAYRAFFAYPEEAFSTSTGQTTNAVFGFTSMLLKALELEEPTHVAVAFDLGRQTFRLEEYPEYKAGRAKTPESFHGQVDLIKKMLEAFGVPVVTKPGFEADDVLATLAARAAAADFVVEVASGDKDSFQLATDKVSVLYPQKGFSQLEVMTPASIEEKYGVTPANYRGLAALVGEKADNLPGVPGVGAKTAAKWLTAYGDLPGVLEHAEEITTKAGANLREHRADVERNYRLNRLLDDVELEVTLEETELGGTDFAELSTLLDELEISTLDARIAAAFGSDDSATTSSVTLPEVRTATPAEALAFLDEDDAPLGIATDGTYDTGRARADMAAFARGEDVLALDLGECTPAQIEELGTRLGEHPALVMHDAKQQVKALSAQDLPVFAVHTDTELAAYLLVPDARTYAAAELVRTHLGIDLDTSAVPEGELELDVDGDSAATRLGHLAWALPRLAEVLRTKLEENGLTHVLDTIEAPVQEVLTRMELAGIAVDSSEIGALIDEFGSQAEASAAEAYASIGHEVNLGSPKQLQTVLFEELGMPKTKKTKTGYTTDAEALAGLFIKTGHPFLEHLLAYRDTTKLKQTVVGLQATVAEDSRIHTTYLQTVAATGRLSSKDPNLQNIPVRTEAGRRIRHVFVPARDAGFVDLLSADYSQIEMRIMAHLSGDDSLVAAFNAGEDLHSYVGAQVFGVGVDEVSDAQRSKVKAMSYGLVYGLSAFGLSQQLRIEVAEANHLMEQYFERFGRVKQYLDEIVETARSTGYTETMYGRRRYLPQLTSANRQVRAMGERAALNAPIQGSAADIMKLAMLRVDAAMREAGLTSRMLLQVHDEIIVEVAQGELGTVEELVRTEMGRAAELSVPLAVNVGRGDTWQNAAH